MTAKYRWGGTAIAGAAVLFFANAGMASAEDIQDQAQIRSAIEAAFAPRLAAMHDTSSEIEVGTIDSRLRLPACSNIGIELPPTNAATMTAKIGCQDPAWTLYVPIHLRAWVNVIVASTNLPPNTVLTASHLTHGRADAFASGAGLITDSRQVEGKILRNGIMAGAPILSTLLDMPIAVHRGQKVMLTLTSSEMTIKTTAMAMEDGHVGDSISVENPESHKTLQATVARNGGVEIKF